MKPTFIIIHNIDVSTFFPSSASWFVEHGYLRMLTGFAVYESYGSLPAVSSEQRNRTCWEASILGTKALSRQQRQALHPFLMLANCLLRALYPFLMFANCLPWALHPFLMLASCLPRARPRCWNTKPIRERKQGLSSDSQPQAEWQKGILHLHRRWKRWGSVFEN